MTALHVVLDTNVWVSGLAYPASVPGRILAAWQTGQLRVSLSHAILAEIARVLPRLPRIALAPQDIRDLTDSLMLLADLVEPDPAAAPDPHLREPTDQPILATLLAAQAQYLVTGDKDLLALADAYPIVTPAQFWARHGG